MAADLIYNFNENDTSTIRDYSDGGGQDGTGSGLSTANSSRVGKDMVFNATTDQIDMGNITLLNGVSTFSLHFGIKMAANIGTNKILVKSGVIDIEYAGVSSAFNVTLTDSLGGTSTVTTSLDTSFHDIDITLASNTLKIFRDGVEVDSDNTLTAALATNSNTMYIGYDGTTNAAAFNLNEVQIFSGTEISSANITALINQPNGVLSDSGESPFAVGDIISTNLLDGTKLHGIVSWVGGGGGTPSSQWRFYPISSGFLTGLYYARTGHLWDSTRRDIMTIKDGEVCWYDGASQTSEVLAASTKLYCLSSEGLIKESSTKTANYTVVSTDQRIYVDSSGGAFTITLEASPSTNREIEIIDSAGSCAANTVTVGGGGNNIIGSSNYLMTTNYEGLRLIFNGTNWNLN